METPVDEIIIHFSYNYKNYKMILTERKYSFHSFFASSAYKLAADGWQ